ncbi:MAG: surfeit 1 [Stappia sp.]|nr:surfeit 1 [Stappia sp.]
MPSSDTSSVSRETPRKGGLVLLSVLSLIAFAILLALGTWQVQRLKWKLDLIERVEARGDAAPVAMPGPAAWPDLTDEEWDYRPIEVSGRFLLGEVYYFISLSDPRGDVGGPGYFVYQPFETEDGLVVMVNRGFVPDTRRLPETRPGSEADEGRTTIVGLWRRNEHGNFLTLAPDLGKRIWFVRDAREMAAELGQRGDNVAPFTLDLTASFTPAGGLPQAGETIITFTNNHLQYVVTWYGLAAVLVVVYVVYVRRHLGRSHEDGAAGTD